MCAVYLDHVESGDTGAFCSAAELSDDLMYLIAAEPPRWRKVLVERGICRSNGFPAASFGGYAGIDVSQSGAAG